MTDKKLERAQVSVETLKHFITGGHGTMTLTNANTRQHTTLRFAEPKVKKGETRDPNAPIFVKLFTGDATSEIKSSRAYSYFGCIWRKNSDGSACPPRFWFDSRKARGGIRSGDGCVDSVDWLMKIAAGKIALPSHMELWHEGICCFCGRPLTQTESIKRGYGPVCAEKRSLDYGKTTNRTKKHQSIREGVDSIPDKDLRAKPTYAEEVKTRAIKESENEALREAAAERREVLRKKAEGKTEQKEIFKAEEKVEQAQSACADSLDGFKWVGR